LLAWFDRWVMGMTSAPIPEKPLLLSFESPREHGKGWRTLTGWTAAGSDPVHYEISADATLVDKASSAGPLTFQEPGDKGLVFTTAALDMDRVLIGRATLELRATLSGPDANFYLHLLDVDERGTETFVNDGYLKASHRSSHTEPSPVPMGQTLDYQIEIRPQHYRFRAGHRLRIQLWGGPADSLVQPTPVEVAVEAGPHSILHLPGFAGTH
jgi:predicted acyl esterase